MRKFLAIFTSLMSFVLALTSVTGWVIPILELITSLFTTVTGQMINADNGGCKMKMTLFHYSWENFSRIIY